MTPQYIQWTIPSLLYQSMRKIQWCIKGLTNWYIGFNLKMKHHVVVPCSDRESQVKNLGPSGSFCLILQSIQI